MSPILAIGEQLASFLTFRPSPVSHPDEPTQMPSIQLPRIVKYSYYI